MKPADRVKVPWRERNGRFSPLKASVFAGLFLPALWIVYLALTGALDPKVVTEMIHLTGKWTIRFLLLSLLVTPLMRGARYPKLVAVRRMVGVAAFAYATAHLTLYVIDQHFDLPHVASEIALRFYLTIGFVAWLGLVALAATSTDAMIRRLGGARWSALHKLIYAIGVLGLLHFLIQAKADITEPAIMVGFFLILMLFRIALKRGASPLVAALTAALASPVLTALIEAGWYAFARHIPFAEVLGANVDPDSAFRPAAWVVAAGLCFLGVVVSRRVSAPRPARTVARKAA
jgi:methionine sulfoxide reductase heme-binding subunit